MDGVSYLTHRVDGELGCWTAVEWRPVHLRDAVERFWHFTGRTAHPRERVLPTGLLQLVVHLDARYGVVREGGVERCPALVMSGQQTQSSVIEAPSGPSTVLGVELTPEGAWRLQHYRSSREASAYARPSWRKCGGRARSPGISAADASPHRTA